MTVSQGGRRLGAARTVPARCVVAIVMVAAVSGACARDRDGHRSASRPTTAPTTTAASTTTSTATTTTTTAPASTTTAKPAPPPRPATRRYPWRRGITATTFWVGEMHDASAEDGSQVCSTYDANWALHWSGVATGAVPDHAPGCPGSPTGGCDGTWSQGRCVTERRDASNGFFPRGTPVRENPFYLDLPYDDVNDRTGFSRRCAVVPWANDPGYAGRCGDRSFSYLKNRWVEIVGPNRQACYGQIQDAGPARYDDASYVFGAGGERPASPEYNNAGIEVSPALNGCLGFKELNGSSDRVDWRFVDEADVAAGPWRRVITRSPVDHG